MSSKIEELKLDVAELHKLHDSAERQKVKDLLQIEIRKLETEILKLTEMPSAVTNKNASANQEPAHVRSSQRCYEVKLNNYAWDQSDKFIKIFVSLKLVESLPPENVKCCFTKRSVELRVTGLEDRNYTLPIKNLMEDIYPDESYWKIKKDKVVIFLAKKNASSKWSHMTTYEKKASEPKLPKYDQNEDPSAGLMDMMRQMYEDGDDDMKRTIAKAWTESRDKQLNPFE